MYQSTSFCSKGAALARCSVRAAPLHLLMDRVHWTAARVFSCLFPACLLDSLGKTMRGMFRMSGRVVRSVRGMLGLCPSVRGRGQAHLQAHLLPELQVSYLRPWSQTITPSIHVPSYAVTQRNGNQQHKTGRLRIMRDD